MGMNITQKIISNHIVEGDMTAGSEIAIKIDQTLTQDATGTMAYLQFEAMGRKKVQTELSVSYVDHNTLQTGFENADDHRYLQSVAAKYGVVFSRPGNGICHQVHLERFGVPGKTLLGSDSHTPTGGGIGMLAIGAGGLSVAAAMAGMPFYLKMPVVVGIELTGELRSGVSAKDIILEVLRQLSVKGGVGKVMEYYGEGVKTLSVPQRATITNMGAELGATSSVFPSDNETLKFMNAQSRESGWTELAADPDALYDETLQIDLGSLEPMVACPDSPDNVKSIKELEGMKVQQVAIGSCTNSSYSDLAKTARILKGKTIHPDVSLVISPGSRQVMQMLASDGTLADIISSGARILETACGPCIGMGQAPPSAGVTLRSFNRNFKGRSATADAGIYLASPEVCAASALTGVFTNPCELDDCVSIQEPEKYSVNDSMIICPPEDGSDVEIIRGPNIEPCPTKDVMPQSVKGEVLIKVTDNITTDHILPGGAKVLPLRSNIPKISEYVFSGIDTDFVSRAKKASAGFIVGGINYGQGSSREHAALAPMYLGVIGVISKSFARIHKDNLVNFGIIPLVFCEEADYEKVLIDNTIVIEDISEAIAEGREVINAAIENSINTIPLKLELDPRQREILLAGGFLNYIRQSEE